MSPRRPAADVPDTESAASSGRVLAKNVLVSPDRGLSQRFTIGTAESDIPPECAAKIPAACWEGYEDDEPSDVERARPENAPRTLEDLSDDDLVALALDARLTADGQPLTEEQVRAADREVIIDALRAAGHQQ